MMLRILPFLLFPLLTFSQDSIPFMISATPCSMCLVYNKHVEWIVAIEPENNCAYDWNPCVDVPEFKAIEGGDGTSFLHYSTSQRGKHHLLLVEKSTGRELAYAVLYIDYHMLSKYGGVPLDVVDSRKLSLRSFDGKYATWAPTRHNKVDGLFKPGILVPFKDWLGINEMINLSN